MSQPPRRRKSPGFPETSAAAGEASLGSVSPRLHRSRRPSSSPGAASPSASPRRANASRRGTARRYASGVPSRTRAEQDEAWASLVDSGKVAKATVGLSTSASAPQLQDSVQQAGGSSMRDAGGSTAAEHLSTSLRRRAAARSSTSPGVSVDPGTRPGAETLSTRARDKRRASPETHSSSSRAVSPRPLDAPRRSAAQGQQSSGKLAEPAPKRHRSSHAEYVASSAGSEASTSRHVSSTATPRMSGISTPSRVSPRPLVAEVAGRRYVLSVLQEPVTGSAFGGSLLSRLAVAPPLILQLRITDDLGNEVSPVEELPYLVCHMRLLTDEGFPADLLSPTTSSVPSPDRAPQDDAGPSRAASTQGSQDVSVSSRSVRMLYGTLVSSPLQLPSPSSQDGSPGTFFVFPEVSVRARGRFRLRVLLLRTPDTRSEAPVPGHSTTVLDTVTTQPLDVLLSADYVAPAITDLTRYFARQGVGLLLPPGAAAE